MSEGAATLAADGTVLYCNRRLSDLLGVPLERIIGSLVTRHLAKRTAHAIEALIGRARADDSITVYLNLRSVRGRCVPVQLSLRKMNAVENAMCCMVVTDLTERKAEDELVTAGKLSRLILENVADAIAVCDDKGNVIAGNKAFEDLCGCNPLFQAFDVVLPLETTDEFGKTGQRFHVAEPLGGITFRGRKMHFRGCDGQSVPLLISASPLRTPQFITGCVLTMTDITERERAEQALQESELRFRLALSSAPVAVAMQDCDLVFRWEYNQRISPPEGIVGLTDADLFAPEDVPAILEIKKRVLLTGVPEHIQRWVTIRGQRRFLESFYEPLREGEGEITGLGIAAVDLTARKQAEEALLSSQEQLQAIIDGAPDTVVFLKDLEGRFITVNSHFEKLLGIRREDVRGKTDYDLPTRERADYYRAHDHLVLTTGRSIQIEELVLLADGKDHTFLANKFPLADANGKPYAVCAIAVDITERKHIEEELRLVKERFEIALRNSRMVVFNQDLDLRYTWIYNPALGLKPQEVIGKFASEIFECAEDAAVLERIKREVITTGVGCRKEVIIHHMGAERCFDLTVDPLRDPNGQIAGVTCASVDITERKQADEDLRRGEVLEMQRKQLKALAARLQRAREEERKRVARDLHDQIGQILTAIKIDMAWISRQLPEVKNAVHDRIASSVKLINEGVRSVRSICSGLRPGILDDLGLPAAIEWQGNEFASRTGITIEVTLPPGELRLDSDRAIAVFRIFQEGLTNVARHAEAKTIRISLSEDRDELSLIVKDDGKGFCEAEIGPSLGLLGMKERAQMCGGSVQISSSPGKGTTVTVRVPLRSADAALEDDAHSHSR